MVDQMRMIGFLPTVGYPRGFELVYAPFTKDTLPQLRMIGFLPTTGQPVDFELVHLSADAIVHDKYYSGNLCYSALSGVAVVGANHVNLSPERHILLRCLLMNQGLPVSRSDLSDWLSMVNGDATLLRNIL